MIGLPEAIQRLPPTASGGTERTRANSTAVSGVSVTLAIPGTNVDKQLAQNVWITLCPVVACRIRFGISTLGSAVITDRIFFAGGEVDYWVPPGTTHFSVIADTTAGELSWHVSSP